MGAQAPQWLLTSFVDAMQQIGATAAETDLEHEAQTSCSVGTHPIVSCTICVGS